MSDEKKITFENGAIIELIKEDSLDVCGAGPMELSKEDLFNPACAAHDDLFVAKHSGETAFSRREADNLLLDNLLLLASSQGTAFARTWNKGRAYLFYGIAKTFGKIWWRRK